MDIFDLFAGILHDNQTILWIVGSAFPLFGLWLIFSHFRRVKQDIQRRVAADPGEFSTTILESGARIVNRARRTIESVAAAGGVEGMDEKSVKALRAKLVQAGYFDKSAVSFFFGLRLLLAAGLGISAALVFALFIGIDPWTTAAFSVLCAFVFGYFLPSYVLDRKIKRSASEHRSGFPDFMDLMVVCVEAGLSMEAGLQRIASELRQSYPSLAMHLDVTTVEIRSGKTLSASVESFARRLGIEEASSFSTLLTQSEELGASLGKSLRIYSDDMRNKRMMKAEQGDSVNPAFTP